MPPASTCPTAPAPAPPSSPTPPTPPVRFGPVVEIHVPGLDRDLYGHALDISFTRRLRGHIPFPDAAAAAAQIARDPARPSTPTPGTTHDPRFPRHGKISGRFPRHGKNACPLQQDFPHRGKFRRFFHAMEKFFRDFPRHKLFTVENRKHSAVRMFLPRRPQDVDASFFLEWPGASRENTGGFSEVPLRGRPELDSCPREVGRERQNGKDAGWFSRRPIPKEILSSLPSAPPRPAAA